MNIENQTFNLSGPLHLTSIIDWDNLDHTRCVASSLVQGVYVQERDRDQKRKGDNALAPPWWKSFDFELIDSLKDWKNFIFAAVYKSNSSNLSQNAPLYVIAFRGTITDGECTIRDFRDDIRISLNKIHNSRCIKISIQEIKKRVEEVGVNRLWLVGHSLGASLALHVGKIMVTDMNCYIQTYLFNSPFVSIPLEKFIKSDSLKRKIHVMGAYFKGKMALAFKDDIQRNQEYEKFVVLSKWKPYLFVNPNDIICCEYIGYFRNRKDMKKLELSTLGSLATMNATKSLFSIGFLGRESNPGHAIPSAYLTVNSIKNFGSHSLCQWWQSVFNGVTNLHTYPD